MQIVCYSVVRLSCYTEANFSVIAIRVYILFLAIAIDYPLKNIHSPK